MDCASKQSVSPPKSRDPQTAPALTRGNLPSTPPGLELLQVRDAGPKTTWTSPDKRTRERIDYIGFSRGLALAAHDPRVGDGIDLAIRYCAAAAAPSQPSTARARRPPRMRCGAA